MGKLTEYTESDEFFSGNKFSPFLEHDESICDICGNDFEYSADEDGGFTEIHKCE